MSERDEIVVYTDGGASPNPGPGGWGAVVLRSAPGGGEPRVEEMSGGEADTTNNRMELTAALRALAALPADLPVRVVTDSQYLRRGITRWLPGWQAAGWKRKRGESVANEDLWRALGELVAERSVRWEWVKGHAGHRWNERADELATAATKRHRTAAGAADETAASGWRIYLKASGRGWWAARVVDPDGGDELLTGEVRRASANELILRAAGEAIREVPEDVPLTVYSAADYLRDGAARWLPGWRRRGWKTATGKPVANREAWQRLASVLAGRTVRWPKVGDEAAAEIAALAKAARPPRSAS